MVSGEKKNSSPSVDKVTLKQSIHRLHYFQNSQKLYMESPGIVQISDGKIKYRNHYVVYTVIMAMNDF